MAIQRHLNWHLSSTPPTLPALRTLNLQHWQLNPLMPLSAFAFHSAAFGLELEFEFCFSFLFAYLGCSQLSLSLSHCKSLVYKLANGFRSVLFVLLQGQINVVSPAGIKPEEQTSIEKKCCLLMSAAHTQALKSVAYL